MSAAYDGDEVAAALGGHLAAVTFSDKSADAVTALLIDAVAGWAEGNGGRGYRRGRGGRGEGGAVLSAGRQCRATAAAPGQSALGHRCRGRAAGGASARRRGRPR